MDDQRDDREGGGSITTPKRFRFGRFLLLLVMALAAVCAATYRTGRDLIWQMTETARANAKLNVIELQIAKKNWENYAREQNRLKAEENWFQRLMSGTDSPPISEEFMQRELKEYDDKIAEAEKKLGNKEQK